jgi:proteasome lid subunit RPN8/RPN11
MTSGHALMPAAVIQQLIDHARAGYPNEACGIVVGKVPAADGGHADRFLGLTNAAASPSRYLIDPQEQLRAMIAIEDGGDVVWAIFHSHVRSPAEPSPTDIDLALYPDALYLICSLQHELPEVRAFSIADGEVTEVPVEVTP